MPLEARVAGLRREAGAVLRPLADLAAPVASGAEPAWDELVRIREHEVDAAARCPASIAFDAPFDGWRATFARRQLGLVVLERWRRGATLDASAIARAVIADEVRTARSGLAAWLATLDSGGVAAVVREAVWFAVATRAALRAWPPPSGTRFDDRFTWDVAGRAVRLEARIDAVDRPSRTLLVLAAGHDDDDGARLDLAWPALVTALATGQLPARVTRVDLASGDRRTVPVTDDVLDHGLTAAAAAVAAVMAALHGPAAEVRPGPWCAHCSGHGSCVPGGSWLVAHAGHFAHAR